MMLRQFIYYVMLEAYIIFWIFKSKLETKDYETLHHFYKIKQHIIITLQAESNTQKECF